MNQDSERWERVQELFRKAAERPPAEREAFLASEARDHPELASEVRRLLAADAAASGFLEEVVRAEAELADISGALEPTVPERIGKYAVRGVLGEGGFGVVYSGRDPDLERDVAIKTCTSRSADLRRRFFREARIAARLSHPRITTVHDFGQEGSVPYLVQELLDGHDLQESIDRRDPIAPAVRLGWLLQIAEGLRYAHEQGVLHRDVKPGNVRILSDGRVKIMDFGIAKLLHEASGLTETGVAVGTIGYLAPEQLQDRPVGSAADLFAFGVLAYELLTYRRPFVGSTFSAVSYALLNVTPEPVQDLWPQCPSRLAALVEGCLAKEPGERPGSFQEIEGSLRAILRELDPDLPWPDPPPERPSPRSTIRLGEPVPGSGAGSGSSDLEPTIRLRSDEGRVVARRRAVRMATAAALVVAAIVAGGLWIGSRGASPVLLADPASRPPPETEGQATREAPGDDATPVAASLEAPELDMDGARPGPSSGTPDVAAPQEIPRQPATQRSAASAAAVRSPDADRVLPATLESEPPGDTGGSSGASREPDPEAVGPGDAGTPPVSGASPAPTTTTSPDEGPAAPAAEEESAIPTAPEADLPTGPVAADTAIPPMRLGDWIDSELPGVRPPELLSHPDPEYPPRARRRGEEARVRLGLQVDETGRVVQVVTLQPSGSNLGFDEAAREVAAQARYRPGTRDGVPGKMWTELVVEFERPEE
jgi:serine/threonine-protein kinase